MVIVSEPTGITDRQVLSAIKYCEIKQAELSRELQEMKARSGTVELPAEPPAVPWFQTPEYLAEKQQREEREELARAAASSAGFLRLS